jgi:hypothetical protein
MRREVSTAPGYDIGPFMPNAIPSRPADTTADAERVQVTLLRAAPVARRLHLAWSLSASVIGAARRALARSAPSASARERDLWFVALHYGSEIADGLRRDLERRDGAGRSST